MREVEHDDGTIEEYAENGVLIKYTWPCGQVQEYDEKGVIKKVSYSDGQVQEYDGKGVIKKVSYSDGYVEEYYGNGDLRACVIDGNVFKFDKVEFGKMRKVTLPDGSRAFIQLNEKGRIRDIAYIQVRESTPLLSRALNIFRRMTR